ncbi:Arylsulfotrans domain containing protein [Croceitalea dokdonensis DOKDO 023]|uniref:Arylsulfotrans domain containing protein n=1 Tax=Croceitalea dokdonensis DOKDO 023 TaxID=1300341 RepID=A0A0P7B0I5_9FLAO|nr:aryl-sulfate sulfotransferase [Croceitalea dokdonensis]KPM31409.1 Arylsulfotrans domain containing protein [Croceitalea dokdonensis DOKDO 023]
MFKTTIIRFLFLTGFLFCLSCTKEADTEEIEQIEETNEETEEPIDEPVGFTPIGDVEMLNPNLVDPNLILVNDAGNNRVYLMTKEAELLYEWPLTNNIGNDVFLMPNGNLIASLEADEPQITLGGKGGKLQIIEPSGNVSWEFVYSSKDGETHHDAEMLPNGNVLAMVWRELSPEQATEAGFMLETQIYPESLIEINPNTNEIVWEWDAMDHIVQDIDENKSNFGNVRQHPELIDINFTIKNGLQPDIAGDFIHANGIAYDPKNDLIFLSANFYSEVWVIDHSTTTEEAASHTGGQYGKGGDLVYRFGNPQTYGNTEGTRLFYNNHHPNFPERGEVDRLLIYSNGNGLDQSTVYELQLPSTYQLTQDADNEPIVTWSFTDAELYSARVSGAVELDNGNILITEGDFGYWEVTRNGEVVWKFSAPGFFWRGYDYGTNADEINMLPFGN